LGSTGETPGSGQTFEARKGLAFGVRNNLTGSCSDGAQPPVSVRKAPAPSARRKRPLVIPIPIVKIYTIESALLHPESRRIRSSRSPRPRKALVSVRMEDLVTRFKGLAAIKSIGYQTLLRQFVANRVYEEEKREGVLK
jgi:hypothetical protein